MDKQGKGCRCTLQVGTNSPECRLWTPGEKTPWIKACLHLPIWLQDPNAVIQRQSYSSSLNNSAVRLSYFHVIISADGLASLKTKFTNSHGLHIDQLNKEWKRTSTACGCTLPCWHPPDNWGIQQAGWQPQGFGSRSWSPGRLSAGGARRSPLREETEGMIVSWEPGTLSQERKKSGNSVVTLGLDQVSLFGAGLAVVVTADVVEGEEQVMLLMELSGQLDLILKHK